jgi:hypothetical protein
MLKTIQMNNWIVLILIVAYLIGTVGYYCNCKLNDQNTKKSFLWLLILLEECVYGQSTISKNVLQFFLNIMKFLVCGIFWPVRYFLFFVSRK